MKPYVIFREYQLGVIGFITNTTSFITEGASSVNFLNPVGVVQKYVDELHARGIRRIICLSHNGYIDDQYLAENTKGISLIVGGHSHSLLLKNLSAPGVEGLYPTEVKNLAGSTTYVLQAHRFGDYLGHVDLKWNAKDELISLKGDPILLDQSIPKDPVIQARVDNWRKAFEAASRTVLAQSLGDFSKWMCYDQECPMGNLITDAFLDNQLGQSPDLAMTNSGGIRSSFGKGNVTMADVLTVLPFTNYVAVFNATGNDLLEILERCFAGKDRSTGRVVVSSPQFSGLEVVYNPKAPEYSRVKSVLIQKKPLEKTRIYKIVTNDFVAKGGDAIMNETAFTTGSDISQVVMDYLKKVKTIDPKLENRIVSNTNA